MHPRSGNWGRHCLLSLDVPEVDAICLADSLVQTSLWGIDSHGIARSAARNKATRAMGSL